MKQLLCILMFITWGHWSVGQETATLHFFRSTGFHGSAGRFNAFIDGTLVCKLNNRRYSTHEVTPGQHTITVQFGGKRPNELAEPILLEVEGGKTYYVQMVFESGVLVDNLYCLEVTERSAKTILPRLKEDPNCL